MSFDLSTAKTAHAVFAGAAAAGLGEQDISTVYKYLCGGRELS